ncbi:MAG: AAA family ATPase [Dehalococcoidia bacterium]
MAVVTVQGMIGSEGQELAAKVARLLTADYVDRFILAEAARRIGATVEAVAQKEESTGRLSERLGRFLQRMLERSAVVGASGEPFFGPGLDVLLARDYSEVTQEPITTAQQLDDKHFIEVTTAIIREIAQAGNVVIIGRGANIILKETPQTLHVATIAPMELRVRTMVEREQLGWKEAEQAVLEREKARVAYFKKFFKVHPDDPSLYHLVLNMGRLSLHTAAKMVAQAATDLAGSSPSPATS